MLRGLVVADDLTGACDTGHAFAARGHRTRVALDPTNGAGGADVLVVDTDSRYEPPDAAAESVRVAVEAHPAAVVYKKIDSTLRGNVAAEIEAALKARADSERTDGDGTTGGPAVVAPAAPATGRTTACGFHLIEGRLVTDTEPGQDPDKGPSSARVPELLAEVATPVEHAGIGIVASGPAAVAERFRERAGHSRIVTADATHETHLSAIAAGAGRVDEPTVYAGSAGLAGHLTLPGEETDENSTGGPPRPSPPDGTEGVLGVVGSVAPQTLAALEAVPSGIVVALDPEATIEDPDRTARRAAEQAGEAIARNGRAVVTAATERSAVDRTLAAGDARGLSARETRDRVAGTLARTASTVVESRQPAGFVLTGGDTAVAVLDALEATAISLSGEAIEAAIPLGAIEGGTASGSALITKAGAFGGRETVINCLDYLQQL